MRLCVILILVFCLASCTSIPSSYKLEKDQFSFGMNLRFQEINGKFLPSLDFDLRKYISEYLDIGLTISPGFVYNLVNPYLVMRTKINAANSLNSFVSVPFGFTAGPGVWWPALGFSTGFDFDTEINTNSILYGFSYDSLRALGDPKKVKWYSGFYGDIIDSQEVNDALILNQFSLDFTGNMQYGVSAIFWK